MVVGSIYTYEMVKINKMYTGTFYLLQVHSHISYTKSKEENGRT